MQGLVNLYPDDPSAGAPYNTGPLYNIYPEYKRLASILGDITFTLTRRVYLNSVSSQVPSWSYLASYLDALPVLGTFHSTDIIFAYDELNQPSSVPVESVQAYYISFVNELDPNALGTKAPLIPWPKYTTSKRQLLQFNALNNALLPDTFRQPAAQYLSDHSSQLKV